MPRTDPDAFAHCPPQVGRPGQDLLDTLRVRELRDLNARLGADVAHAVHAATADRWDAFALVAWAHARREDPDARLETYTDLTASELLHVLRLDQASRDQDAQGQADASDPSTRSTPAPAP